MGSQFLGYMKVILHVDSNVVDLCELKNINKYTFENFMNIEFRFSVTVGKNSSRLTKVGITSLITDSCYRVSIKVLLRKV